VPDRWTLFHAEKSIRDDEYGHNPSHSKNQLPVQVYVLVYDSYRMFRKENSSSFPQKVRKVYRDNITSCVALLEGGFTGGWDWPEVCN